MESCLAPGTEALPGLDQGLGAGEGPGPLQEADPRPGLGQDPKGEGDPGVEGAREDQGHISRCCY